MRNMKRRTGLFLALLLALVMLLAACGSDASSATPTPTTPTLVKGEFVGDVGTLGGFGLSTDGQQLIAYLCDGTTTHLSLAEWFKGSVTNNSIDITNAHGSHLAATLTPQAVTGTITLKDGRSSPFTAKVISDPNSEFGLYRSEQTINGVQYLGGWIHNPPNQAISPVEVQAFLARPLPTCCVPDSRDRGGFVNEQTGALIPSPPLANLSLEVPNLGAFTLRLCRQGTC